MAARCSVSARSERVGVHKQHIYIKIISQRGFFKKKETTWREMREEGELYSAEGDVNVLQSSDQLQQRKK